MRFFKLGNDSSSISKSKKNLAKVKVKKHSKRTLTKKTSVICIQSVICIYQRPPLWVAIMHLKKNSLKKSFVLFCVLQALSYSKTTFVNITYLFSWTVRLACCHASSPSSQGRGLGPGGGRRAKSIDNLISLKDRAQQASCLSRLTDRRNKVTVTKHKKVSVIYVYKCICIQPII